MKAKKFVAILLAAVMTLALCSTAFAADPTYSVSIPNEVEGYTYAAYQIFTGRLEDGTLSDIVWGANISAAGKTALGDAAAYAKSIEGATKAEAEEIADTLAGYLTGDPATTATAPNTDKDYVLSGLAAGYYIIKNTAVPTDGAYTDYMLQVVEDVEVEPKASVPTVVKEIVEGTDTVKANEASIGDDVEYKITGTLPSTIDTYKTYSYKFTDTLSEGLTYNDDVTVTVNDVDATEEFTIADSTDTDTGITTITISIADLLALDETTYGTITAKTTVVVEYTATLNENAVIGAANENKVKLTYSNDPNFTTGTEPTGTTPESAVETYTTEITILKTDEELKALSGAAFKLTGDSVNIVITTGNYFVENASATTPYYPLTDGSYTATAPTTETADSYVGGTGAKTYELKTEVILGNVDSTPVAVEAFVGDDGYLTFTGLGAGKYTLEETVTPKGYNELPKDFEFEITFDAEKKEFSATSNADTKDTDAISISGNKLSTTIINQSGSVLPETGGIGTTIFYIVGGILVAGAAVLLITKKRMKVNG